jgi:hypothetical protein
MRKIFVTLKFKQTSEEREGSGLANAADESGDFSGSSQAAPSK